MNCTVCGYAYMYGSGNNHARCREIENQQKERELRIDVLLEMFAEDIDRRLMRDV